MARRTRDYVLIVLSTLFVALTMSLGFWQLRRRAQRLAQNAEVISRLADPPVPVRQLTHDSAALHYRRVILNGRYDYSRQIKIAYRSRDGSPGINIVTPLIIPGTDTAVLVNRGWVYAPDGRTVDLSRWREADSVSGTGYARPLFRAFPGSPALPGRPDSFRWIDLSALRSRLPYPVFPFVIVLEGDANSHGNVPPRVPPPPLDEGPHLSYAIQWFSFAVIAVVGMYFFLRSSGRARSPVDEILSADTDEPDER
jgi:surfeit locus 1 family protein